jgi:hypothetical protein
MAKFLVLDHSWPEVLTLEDARKMMPQHGEIITWMEQAKIGEISNVLDMKYTHWVRIADDAVMPEDPALAMPGSDTL